MCGIIGYVGNKKVIDVLIQGLEALEYRGYDSAGVALLNNGEYKIIKSVGRIENLKKEVNKYEIENSNIGIAHTRWATHGEVNEINCHPHIVNDVILVHNGIIENYKDLKSMLEDKGYTFNTATDTEVACALIDYYYRDNNEMDSIKKAVKSIRGSFALLIMFKNDKENLYAVRKDSPLIVGLGEAENFIASSISAILGYTKKYFLIEENEIVIINDKDYKILLNNKEISKEIKTAEWNKEEAEKQGFEHYMLKEINDQIELLDKINSKYLNNYSFSDDLIDISKYERIDIVACGSAYYAGLIGEYLIDQTANEAGNIIVSSEVASEYRYKKHYYNKKSLVIVISQSGETADTLASLRMAKENGVDTLAIVNVPSSTIAREAKYVIPMLAGPEICVATTKGYFSQTQILSLLALKICEKNRVLSKRELKNIINESRSLKKYLQPVIKADIYEVIANEIFNKEDIYFIGRGIDSKIIMEASLKLKEISYIHSEAYQAGELKHGPIALIEKDTPLIALITSENLKEKMISNIVEAKTRGAYVIVVSTEDLEIDSSVYDYMIKIPKVNEFIEPLLAIVPFQLIAYFIAKKRGCDIDKPRNLAKSVTVE